MFKALEIPGIFSTPALNSKRITAATKADSFWYFASLSLILTIAFLFINYLFGVNNYASSGYEIKKLQNQFSGLAEENKKLYLKASEASLMLNIQNELSASGYVSAGTPTFLTNNQFTKR
jgi:hypothetical protein